MDTKIFGERIRQLRRVLGLTQKEVVEQIGIPLHPYNRLERGENCGWDSVLPVLLFYSQKVSIDNLLDDRFCPIDDNDYFTKNYEMNQVAKARLEFLRQKLQETAERKKAVIDEETKALLDKINNVEEIL